MEKHMNGYVEIPPELPLPGDIMLIEYAEGLETWRLSPHNTDPAYVWMEQTRRGRRVDAWACDREALKNYLMNQPHCRRLLRRVPPLAAKETP